jgi:hypothetical protein
MSNELRRWITLCKDDLLEKRIVLDPERGMMVYENPSATELRRVLDETGQLRGMAAPHGSLYVWDAYAWTHAEIEKYVDQQPMWYYLYFSQTRSVSAAPEWSNDIRRIGDIYVGANWPKETFAHPMFQRAMGNLMRS